MNDPEDRLSRHVRSLTPEQPAPFGGVLAQVGRRRRRRRTLVACGTAMTAVTAIAIGSQLLRPDRPADSGGPATPGPSATSSPTTGEIRRAEPAYEWSDKPSPVVLRLADRDLELKPWSYCWTGPTNTLGTESGLCADGIPPAPDDLENAGSPKAVGFWFGMEGWAFEATFVELGEDCPRQHTVRATPTGARTFRLDPPGPPGRYQVDLSGDGPEGDVHTSFVWTTTTDGPVDQPTAHMALVSDAGDDLSAYQLEVAVEDLAFQPDRAGVEVTATAANGRSMTLDAELQRDRRCYAEGSLFFRGEPGPAQQAARLGPAPYTYEVRLTLDGKEYVGTAVWPRDEKKGEEPYTVLTFDPPLPAYTE